LSQIAITVREYLGRLDAQALAPTYTELYQAVAKILRERGAIKGRPSLRDFQRAIDTLRDMGLIDTVPDRDDRRRVRIVSKETAQPPQKTLRMEQKLQWMKRKRLDIDRFLQAEIRAELSYLMNDMIVALLESFGWSTPTIPIDEDLLGALARTSKKTRPPGWIADKWIDLRIRPGMQALIALLNLNDPRINKPIHKSMAVLKGVLQAEEVINSIVPETESGYLISLDQKYLRETRKRQDA